MESVETMLIKHKFMIQMLGSKHITHFSMILADHFLASLLFRSCVINKIITITQDLEEFSWIHSHDK